MNCSLCGSENLLEGTVVSAGGSAGVYYFQASDRSLLKTIFSIDSQNIA
jgi:hypothetical protein